MSAKPSASEINKRQNVVVWFEIPATNMARAVTFYETLFGVSMKAEQMGPNEMAVFPYDQTSAISGCVIKGAHYVPGSDGAVTYLNADPSIDGVLHKVADAGGKVLLGKTALPPGMGFFAHVLDTEGNRVGLHGVK